MKENKNTKNVGHRTIFKGQIGGKHRLKHGLNKWFRAGKRDHFFHMRVFIEGKINSDTHYEKHIIDKNIKMMDCIQLLIN